MALTNEMYLFQVLNLAPSNKHGNLLTIYSHHWSLFLILAQEGHD